MANEFIIKNGFHSKGNSQVTGSLTATSFSGDGSGLTNLPASSVLTSSYTSEWILGADGTDHYTFSGPGLTGAENDPDIYLVRGQKYRFYNNSGGHPFRIQSTPNGSAGTAYNDGVTNNDAGNGTYLLFDVQFDAPTKLYYQCTSHGDMGGPIYIADAIEHSGSFSGSFQGDGSSLTGLSAFPFTGDAKISGSLEITGSFNSTRTNFLNNSTAGTTNLVIGLGAGPILEAGGTNNTVIGVSSAEGLTTGDNNVIIGYEAGKRDTSTESGNVIIGSEAGEFADQTNSVLIGYRTGQYGNSGDYNVYVGQNVGRGLSNDSSDGDYNVGIGAQAIRLINDGVGNTAAGYRAGEEIDLGNYNIVLGYYAGYSIEAGSNNIVIGSGSLGNVDMSNQLRIGNADLIVISASLSTGDIIFANTASAPNFSGSFQGDGSGLTNLPSSGASGLWSGSADNISNNGGDVRITGSLIVSQSGNPGLTVYSSGSTAFEVIGSVGTLFSVDDSLTGTVFSANDISGLPVLQADATGEVYLGKSPQSLYTTATISSTTANITQSIYGLSTSSYEGVFVDYTATSASNARAGNITAIWNGSSLNFAETTTTDIGDTSNLIMQVAISQSQAQVQSYSTAASYKIKTIIRSI